MTIKSIFSIDFLGFSCFLVLLFFLFSFSSVSKFLHCYSDICYLNPCPVVILGPSFHYKKKRPSITVFHRQGKVYILRWVKFIYVVYANVKKSFKLP